MGLKSTMPRATKKKPVSLTNCSIALAAEMIGDRWTLLLLRELFRGSSRFGEFAEMLGAARNLLSGRLRKLEDNGLVERFPLDESPGRDGYRLTDMGESTFPILASLMQWGDEWLGPAAGPPVIMQERRSGKALGVAVLPQSQVSKSVPSTRVRLTAGPGARQGTRVLIASIEARRS